MSVWVRFLYRHRVVVLVISLLGWVAAGLVIAHGTTLTNSTTFPFESGIAQTLMGNQLPTASGGVPLDLILTSPSQVYPSHAFASEVAVATRTLASDARVSSIETPWSAPPSSASTFVSSDRHSVIVIATLTTHDFSHAIDETPALFREVTSSSLKVTSFGDLAVNAAINSYVSKDLVSGSSVALPAALILLLLMFGTVVAAFTCIVMGIVAVSVGIALTFLLNAVMPVSPYATELVGLIGLGVGIDYSLFITSRFREELAKGKDCEAALVVAYRTAGRAIAFSGIIVAVGLCGMFVFHGTFLVSMGLAGGIVVVVSILLAMTLLASLLALLGERVNFGRLPLTGRSRKPGGGAWRALANFVMAHPVAVLLPTLAIVALIASPFPSITLANSDYHTLPVASPARAGSTLLSQQFPLQDASPVDVVVNFTHGSPFTAGNIALTEKLSQRLRGLPSELGSVSYINAIPNDNIPAFASLLSKGVTPSVVARLGSVSASAISASTGSSIALIQIQTHAGSQSSQAAALVNAVRARDTIAGAKVYVGGATAFNLDFLSFIRSNTPKAAIVVVIATFLLLMVLLRSLVLPVKAVVMNLLSMSAAFGSMVWVFQQGHLGGLLGITPQPIDATLPPLLFCIVFGLSMDYEVFLLSRMKERWDETHDNRIAVADGLESSGRLVTGAAAIMICVFAAFAFGHVVVIKAIGLGMAVAVVVDATLVRAMIVPAIMRLLGRANWWAPSWLATKSRHDV